MQKKVENNVSKIFLKRAEMQKRDGKYLKNVQYVRHTWTT